MAAADLSQSCSGLSEDERMELDLGKPYLTKSLKKCGTIYPRLFTDGVELHVLEQAAAARE
ncbi:MAG TPA: hypothetical protein VNU92_00440 [Edaphobacter sp.]|jgi:hypothetical protein|nr:hypothetical protein [Edaphobacter sp.]